MTTTRKKLKLDGAAKARLVAESKKRTGPFEYAVPELDGVFSPAGEPCIFLVKGASLDDHVKANDIGSRHGYLLDWISRAVKKGKPIDISELTKILEDSDKPGAVHPNTAFEIDLFRRVVVEPKFSLKETVSLSHAFPDVINRVTTFSMGKTQGK